MRLIDGMPSAKALRKGDIATKGIASETLTDAKSPERLLGVNRTGLSPPEMTEKTMPAKKKTIEQPDNDTGDELNEFIQYKLPFYDARDQVKTGYMAPNRHFIPFGREDFSYPVESGLWIFRDWGTYENQLSQGYAGPIPEDPMDLAKMLMRAKGAEAALKRYINEYRARTFQSGRNPKTGQTWRSWTSPTPAEIVHFLIQYLATAEPDQL